MIRIRVKATPEYFIVKNKSRQALISLLAFFIPSSEKSFSTAFIIINEADELFQCKE